MKYFSKLSNFFRIITHRQKEEEELEDEIRFHIESEIQENIRKGMSLYEARKTAYQDFGGELTVKEQCRDSWGIRILDDFFSDLRFALRQLLKNRLQNFILVLTIAICVSAAVLSQYLYQSIVGDPYTYNNEDRIFKVGKAQPKIGRSDLRLSALHFEYIRKNCDAYDAVGLLEDGEMADLEITGQIERIMLDKITPSMWRVVGIKPVWGTFFFDQESAGFDENVVVLSERVWKKLKNEEDREVISQVHINSKPFKVIGVAPESFFLGWERADAWIPKIITKEQIHPDQRNNLNSLAFARLANDQTAQDAAYELQNTYELFLRDYPAELDEKKRTGSTFQAAQVNESIVSNIPELKTAFLSSKLGTIILLSIGCLNISGILTVRVFTRMPEFQMRHTLGASFFRILRQLYTEIILLFFIGALIGIGFIFYGFEFANWMQLNQIPWAEEWKVGLDSFGYMIAIIIIGSLFAATAPLLLLLRKNALSGLTSIDRTTSSSSSKLRIQSVFVVSQIALTFVMLMVSSVLRQNLLHTLSKDIGFEPNNLLAVEIPQPVYRFGRGAEAHEEKILPFQESIITTLQTIPGVSSVSACNRVPISYKHTSYCPFDMDHYEYGEGEEKAVALGVTVRPHYFETIGTSILRGRDFNALDRPYSEPVVIISNKTAEKYYDGLDPLGKTIHIWGRNVRIVGIVETVQDKPFFMDSRQHALYFPSTQWHLFTSDLSIYILKSDRNLVNLTKNVKNVIKGIYPQVSLDTYPLNEVVKMATFTQRLPLYMISFFGIVALLISGLGIFGLVSYTIERRTKELGIRLALGASPKNLLRRVLSRNLLLLLAAFVIGLLISVSILSQVRGIFPDINPLDISNFVQVSAFIFLATATAATIPALKIIKIDAIESLRGE